MSPEMAQSFKELAGAIFKHELEAPSTIVKKHGKNVAIQKLTMDQARQGRPEDIENIDIIRREAIDEAKEFLVEHKDDKNWREALKEKMKQVRK